MENHRCTRCGKHGSQQGCIHIGSWHDSFTDCGPRCALHLGWANVGLQHWGCCYSTDRESRCFKTSHRFDEAERADPAESPAVGASLFGRSDCRRFRVNLDEEPGSRWDHVIEAHIHLLPRIIEIVDDCLGKGVLAKSASTVFAGLNKAGRIFFGEELQGIARVSGIPVGKVALMQVAYEVFAACTSIVVDIDADAASSSFMSVPVSASDDAVVDGKGAAVEGEAGAGCGRVPFHIRTMDWDLAQLQELTVEVDFVKNGCTVFSATTWPGYVGVLTGVKVGVCSISVNYRRSPLGAENPVKGIVENMMRGLMRAWPVSFLVREALDSCTSFDEAVGALSCSDLMAPTYIIMAGPTEGDGVVITRNRTYVATGNDEQSPPQWSLRRDGPIVQANMDHWRDPGVVDSDGNDEAYAWQDICDSISRRAVVREALARTGSVVTPLDLWLLLSLPPCLASDTVYTVAMCPATGALCTRVRVLREHEKAGRRRWGSTVADVTRRHPGPRRGQRRQ
eukprot:TRINITY_DN470_c0_g2_i1.p1 TRINITY_DN470_c0_g2~~TRINITY_DN470_c0_g2_i1.p1  ORF type:complete len:509 (-),score=81.83 TRINITY_DN470_c0_g2_i1:80-1606(-)